MYGSQESFAFSVAWLRQQFRRPNTFFRWTATENMLADCLPKEMDRSHLQKSLERAPWSATYVLDFVRTTQKTRAGHLTKKKDDGATLPGRTVGMETPLERFILNESRQPGWHRYQDSVIQIARNTRALRTPEPRFSSAAFPIRKSYALHKPDDAEWKTIEEDFVYSTAPDQHRKLDVFVTVLASVFFPFRGGGDVKGAAGESA